MMSIRSVSAIAISAALVLSTAGCRTAGLGPITRNDPAPAPPPTLTAAELLSDHNRNAALVQNLEARPSVSGHNRSRLIPGASGLLAFDQPRNFRLLIKGPMSDVADIGSNDDEFWLWFQQDPDKAVYFANYDENGHAPMAIGLRPEWIMDALGIRPISEAEMARMKVSRGREPGTYVLTERVSDGKTALLKEVIVSETSRQLKEQRVLSADGKTVIARTTVSGYDSYDLPAAEPGGPVDRAYIPKKLSLELTQEKLALDVTMKSVVLNKLDPSRREDLFVEPTFSGYERRNLAAQIGAAGRQKPPASRREGQARSSVRETMPAPAPKVQLEEPAPVSTRTDRRSRGTAPALAAAIPADLVPANARGVGDVVGPTIPTAAEPAPTYVDRNSGWRGASRTPLER